MGDRQTFQVMPSAAAGTPPTGRSERALPFRHEQRGRAAVLLRRHVRERAEGRDRADRPRRDAALLASPAPTASLIFDNVERRRVADDRPGTGDVTGWSETRSGLSNGADAHVRLRARSTSPSRRAGCCRRRATATGCVRFGDRQDRDAADRDVVDLARPGQAQPRARDRAVGLVRDPSSRARRAWDAQARDRQVKGATEDQLTTLYSNLYRLNLYPNSAFENTAPRRALGARRAVPTAAVRARRRRPARRRRRQALRQQRLLGHVPDRLARPTRSSTPRTPASSSTASSSSTATAAGSRAGPHPATRT